MSPFRTAAVWAAMPAALALVTALGRGLGANATTIGFLYLVTVLVLAAAGGWAVGCTASILGMLAFNYFFFPPFGSLTVHEPANWVALFAFLAASSLTSHLVASARRREAEAEARRREVETLYGLTFGLFAASQRTGALSDLTLKFLQGIGAGSGRLILAAEDGGRIETGGVGPQESDPDGAALSRAWETRGQIVTTDANTEGAAPTIYLPLHVGGRFYGVLVASGTEAPRSILDPAGRLLALAIERERLLAEAARLEAVRASDELKTTLLRAVSHDLRTPLTAMRLEIESLERVLGGQRETAPDLERLAREQARLTRRIDNLLSYARLEAGLAKLHPEPTPPGALLRMARESLEALLAGRDVATRVAPGCPDLWVDPTLALEILVNLLENAAHAAPPELPLELAATLDPRSSSRVFLEVLDRGPGVPLGVRRLLGMAGNRPGEGADAVSSGLGLYIARSFAEAHGGTLELLDRPGGGTVARLTLPSAPEHADAADAANAVDTAESEVPA